MEWNCGDLTKVNSRVVVEWEGSKMQKKGERKKKEKMVFERRFACKNRPRLEWR